MRKGVKEASLEYEVLKKSSDKALVRVLLHTGRNDQIRVQFASRKMPLVGDGKYGSRDNKATCALWSHKVRFTHPVTKKVIECESSPEGGYPWNLFNDLGGGI
jgi:23S rRNA pseudouridine1911/1915/1917 synthase